MCQGPGTVFQTGLWFPYASPVKQRPGKLEQELWVTKRPPHCWASRAGVLRCDTVEPASDELLCRYLSLNTKGSAQVPTGLAWGLALHEIQQPGPVSEISMILSVTQPSSVCLGSGRRWGTCGLLVTRSSPPWGQYWVVPNKNSSLIHFELQRDYFIQSKTLLIIQLKISVASKGTGWFNKYSPNTENC